MCWRIALFAFVVLFGFACSQEELARQQTAVRKCESELSDVRVALRDTATEAKKRPACPVDKWTPLLESWKASVLQPNADEMKKRVPALMGLDLNGDEKRFVNWILERIIEVKRRENATTAGFPGGGSVAHESAADTQDAGTLIETISPDVVRRAIEEKRWAEAKEGAETLLRTSKDKTVLARARKWQKKALLEIKKTEARKREEEALANVTVAEIYANIGKYRGKALVRQLRCFEPARAIAIPFPFAAKCYVDSGGDEGEVELALSRGALARVSKVPRESEQATPLRGTFRFTVVSRHTIAGIVVRFVEVMPE